MLRRDTLHSLVVAILACVLSGGMVYLYYLGRVLNIALTTRAAQPEGACLLVFGKRLVEGEPDRDFRARIQAAFRLLMADTRCHAMLLGGGARGETEADAACRLLLIQNQSLADRLHLEAQSSNTLENMRNARELMNSLGTGRVTLVSNRYHLARCAQFARQLGLEFQLHPADATMDGSLHGALALLREALCLCWLDIGTHWARLIGHERMIRRVS
jgi:uncharacterized SAM-binding protein YcdF (DUF218 family)